ncbi:hypothetical protein GGR56DRAFT_169880 [Xylariaceae sp. FL0804]|nr:hypothetical protein GGR56DRAFT_169880 [Xylariaceae sp. FL0804]
MRPKGRGWHGGRRNTKRRRVSRQGRGWYPTDCTFADGAVTMLSDAGGPDPVPRGRDRSRPAWPCCAEETTSLPPCPWPASVVTPYIPVVTFLRRQNHRRDFGTGAGRTGSDTWLTEEKEKEEHGMSRKLPEAGAGPSRVGEFVSRLPHNPAQAKTTTHLNCLKGPGPHLCGRFQLARHHPNVSGSRPSLAYFQLAAVEPSLPAIFRSTRSQPCIWSRGWSPGLQEPYSGLFGSYWYQIIA